MIIYPPLIKESAPAFLYHDVVVDGVSASKIIIPFEWNPAVPQAAGISLKLQIKEYFTSTIIDTNVATTPANSAAAIFYVKDKDYVIDNITYTFPTVGQYYKFQIAYDDGSSQELVYSSVALGRCISNNIILQITDMEETQTDQVSIMENCVDYKGIYLRDQLNEPLYSYQFDFKDQFGNILESSGEIIWDNKQDSGNGFKFQDPNTYTTNYSSVNGLLLIGYHHPQRYPTLDYLGNTILGQQTIDNYDFSLKINNTTTHIEIGIGERRGLINTSIVNIERGTELWNYLLEQPRNLLYELISYDDNNYSYTIKNLAIGDYIKSTPTYHLKYEPQIGQTYTMDFTITTINGYSTTVSRSITKQLEESPIYSLPFVTKENHDDGYIELGFADMTNLTHVTLNNINGDSRFPEELQIDYSNGSVDNFHFTPEEGWKTSIDKDLVFSFEIPQPMGPVYDIMYISFPGTFTGQFVLNNPWLWPGKYELKFSDYRGYENSRLYWSANTITISRIADQDGDGNSDAWRINGKFSLERKDMNDNNAVWERITEIYVGRSANLSEWTWRDFSVKPGTEYRYRCRQFNNGHYSIANYGQIMCLQSEDIFLSDANRQLKIRFNPKVSSMKETILETKTDTIGGKYPIFYRNGIVRYREIPISGLISYQMDDNQFFMTNEELGLDSETAAAGSEIKTRTTNLVPYNIQAEKTFREEVLKWLNNGKPKLFRSPTEGTFTVRLMNVSLSPNDTVGRMLWTFSATAYEIANTEFETLKKLQLLNVQELIPEGTNFVSQMWRTENTIPTEGWSTIKNIVWSTLTPVQHAYMLLTDYNNNEYKFYNLTGLFETPKNVVYKNMKLIYTDNDRTELNYSTINYEISGTVYDVGNDDFGNTILSSKWSNLSNGSYSNVYYMSISRNNDVIGSIKINGQTITIDDNQTRYYYDMGNINITEKSDNVIGTIYYSEEATS